MSHNHTQTSPMVHGPFLKLGVGAQPPVTWLPFLVYSLFSWELSSLSLNLILDIPQIVTSLLWDLVTEGPACRLSPSPLQNNSWMKRETSPYNGFYDLSSVGGKFIQYTALLYSTALGPPAILHSLLYFLIIFEPRNPWELRATVRMQLRSGAIYVQQSREICTKGYIYVGEVVLYRGVTHLHERKERTSPSFGQGSVYIYIW